MSLIPESVQEEEKSMTKPLLSVQHLITRFSGIPVVKDISFSISPKEVVALVGESGSGKSVTSLSIMGLLGKQAQVEGTIDYQGKDILSLSPKKRRQLNGKDFSIIFQEPMTSLNPMLRIRTQIAESLIIHYPDLSKQEMRKRVLELLEEVDIPNPEKVAKQFPHQLSGGMRQRVMIAIAVSCNPKLLIADEPTTALDVTTQSQILRLLKRLNNEHDTGILFITHDLSVVAELADRVIVMKDGKIVEQASVFDLFDSPQHPYTKHLLDAMPTLDKKTQLERRPTE